MYALLGPRLPVLGHPQQNPSLGKPGPSTNFEPALGLPQCSPPGWLGPGGLVHQHIVYVCIGLQYNAGFSLQHFCMSEPTCYNFHPTCFYLPDMLSAGTRHSPKVWISQIMEVSLLLIHEKRIFIGLSFFMTFNVHVFLNADSEPEVLTVKTRALALGKNSRSYLTKLLWNAPEIGWRWFGLHLQILVSSWSGPLPRKCK